MKKRVYHSVIYIYIYTDRYDIKVLLPSYMERYNYPVIYRLLQEACHCNPGFEKILKASGVRGTVHGLFPRKTRDFIQRPWVNLRHEEVSTNSPLESTSLSSIFLHHRSPWKGDIASTLGSKASSSQFRRGLSWPAEPKCLQSHDPWKGKNSAVLFFFTLEQDFFSKIFHLAISTFVPFSKILTSLFFGFNLPNAFLARSGIVGWPDPEPLPSRARTARSLSPPKREVPRPPPPRRAPEEGEGDRNGKSWVRIDGNEKRIYIQTSEKNNFSSFLLKWKDWFKEGTSQCLNFKVSKTIFIPS